MDLRVDRHRPALRPRWALLLAVPPLAFLGLFFLWPVANILALGLAPGGRLALAGVVETWAQPFVLDVVLFTLGLAAVSTLVTLLLGLPVAWVFARFEFPGRRVARALTVGERLGGHFVSGHIDDVGILLSREDHGDWATFWFSVPRSLAVQMASKGSVTIDGLCYGIPCKGSLALRYFEDHTVRYDFGFALEGQSYKYLGEKKNIRLWNLPWSHTTCFGRLVLEETGEVVSTSVTHFRMHTLPRFITSIRPA